MIRTKAAQGFRRGLAIVLVLSLIATAAVTVQLFTGEFSWEMAGLLVGLLSMAVTLAAMLSPRQGAQAPADLVDDLARTLKEQWLGEAVSRNLRDPGVLPLSWASTTRDGIADIAPARTTTADGVRVRHLRMHGRLEGPFDDVTRRLAEDYAKLPNGRLVVLGEPGAGKSVIALMLTLGLLNARWPGAPTPVLLTVSSWDPLAEPLEDWIVNSLAGLYYNGRTELPRRLLLHGLLIPVLDGIDEIPESARRGAVQEINRGVGADRPVVATCRSAEYTDVIRGGAPVLYGAPVIEVLPLAAADVDTYLAAVTWPAGTRWDHVNTELRAWEEDRAQPRPAAEALSTPLMVSLARFTYERLGGDPSELLTLDSRHAVENHISERVVTAAYEPVHRRPGEPATGRWTAAQARRWLSFLAAYLHHHGDRDLNWWQLSSRLLSPWTGLVVGVSTWFTVFVVTALVALTVDPTYSGGDAMAVGGIVGFGYALLVMGIWYAVPGRSPGRLALSTHGSLARLRRGFRTGAAIGAVPAALAIIIGSVVLVLSGWSLVTFAAFVLLLAIATTTVLVSGLALAVHSWFDAPPERSALADPVRFLRHDRASAAAGAAGAGVVTGLVAVPALIGAVLGGVVAGRLLTGYPGWAEEGTRLFSGSYIDELLPQDEPFTLIGAYVMPGLAVAGLILLTRAWPRFVVARIILAVRGTLPWRLMRFLADARDKGLLRGVGGSFQFRHIRFQEHLAARNLAAEASGTTAPAVRRARLVLTSAVALLCLGILVTVLFSAPRSTVTDVLAEDGTDITQMALSDRGRVRALATGSGEILIRRAGVDTVVARRLIGPNIRAVAVNPSGTRVAVADGDRVLVLDPGAAALPTVAELPLDGFAVRAAFGPGDLVAVVDVNGKVTVHQGAVVKCRVQLPKGDWDWQMTFGLLLRTRGDLKLLPGPIHYMGETVSVRRIAAPCGTLEAHVIWSDMLSTISGTSNGLAFGVNDKGDPIVVSAQSGDVRLLGFNTTPAELRPLDSIDSGDSTVDYSSTVALSTDGTVLAATAGGLANLWDLPPL
ncbi:hypothetical protein [Actinoplanes couchii]|nr:hypothetical protein [Actinoplanes couchii]MDR6319045.1 hypothetical protein [Actinoplanes couchii]